MKGKLMKIGVIAATVATLVAPAMVLGQTVSDVVPPCTGSFWCNFTITSIGDFLAFLAKFLIAVGVIIAVISIVWGGIMYMYAGNNEDTITSAKARIKNGIIGAVVVLGIGVIIQLISRFVTGDILQ